MSRTKGYINKKSRESSLELSNLGLSKNILIKYNRIGITKLFKWQMNCLRLDGVFDKHKNLVYSAHASVGKCFLAEILVIKTVVERKLKSIIVVPGLFYIQELEAHLQYVLGSKYTVISVTIPDSYFMLDKLKIFDVVICDLDSATITINKLLESQTLNQIGLIVFDGSYLNEFLYDLRENFHLQFILIKILYWATIHLEPKIQLIGMCSTVCDMELIANWISAAFYTTNFRNIPLFKQYSTADGKIYDNLWNQIRKIEPRSQFNDGKGHAIQLCLETVLASGTVIIYCCADDLNIFVLELTSAFKRIMSSNSKLKRYLAKRIPSHQLQKLKEELACDSMDCLQYGIGVYHPGLVKQQRHLLEQGFNQNVLSVMVGNRQMAFSAKITARRILIRGPSEIGPFKIVCYRQMTETAGRNGCDFGAETIFIDTFNSTVTNEGKNLISTTIPVNLASLFDHKKYFQQFILEAITSGLATNNKDLCTLCSFGDHDQDFDEIALQDEIDFLLNKFLDLKSGKYVPTTLGRACVASLILPEDALKFLPKLETISDSTNQLILINFLLTLFEPLVKIDWMIFLNIWEDLSDEDRNVGISMGIDESMLQLMCKRLKRADVGAYKRFFVALMVRESIEEHGLKIVAGKYNCDEDSLRNLQTEIAEHAFKITEFCSVFGWTRLSTLFSQFRYRIYYGVKPELVEILEHNKWLDAVLARALFEVGIRTTLQLATIDITVLKNILHNLKLKPNWMDSMNTTQAANYFVSQARKYLKIVSGTVWENKESIIHPRLKSNERNLMMNANRFSQSILVNRDDLYRPL